MLLGIALGLTVALLWGACDIISTRTMAAYQVATLRFCLLTQPVGVAELLVFSLGVACLSPHLMAQPPLMLPLVLGSLALAGLYAIGCYAVYRGLAAGPLSLVSPLISAQGGVSLLAALALLHDYTSSVQVVLLVAIIAGIVLASTNGRQTLAASRALIQRGPRWAVLALLAMGLLNFGIGLTYAHAGAGAMLWIIVGYRAWSLLLTALASRLVGASAPPRLPLPARLWGASVGLMETSALLVFGWAIAQTDTSIASVLASAYPLLPWAWGALVLRERLHLTQGAGVILVVGGSLLLPFDLPLPLVATTALALVGGGAAIAVWPRVRHVGVPAGPAVLVPRALD